MEGLVSNLFDDLPDPRRGNALVYPLSDLLFIAFVATLGGARDCCDFAEFARSKREFLQPYLQQKDCTASHGTFSRLFRRLDPGHFLDWFVNLMREIVALKEGMSDLPGVLAVDGKTLRRTHDRASHTPALHVVCAYLGDHGLVLAEQATEDRSNEIPTVRALLKMLDPSNTIVTADAMHCQRETAEQVCNPCARLWAPMQVRKSAPCVITP